MRAITVYLDEETEEKLTAFVQGKQISRSEWIATLIQEKLASEWPESVVALVGAWQDFPDIEEIRDGLK